MRKKLSLAFAALFLFAAGVFAATDHREGFQEYKLANGLTVFLWEDEDAPSVHGRFVTRAGSIDEPADYTGLAHYLEHMLFKGTDKIGALDWEKEKPLFRAKVEVAELMGREYDLHFPFGGKDVVAKTDARESVLVGNEIGFSFDTLKAHVFDPISTKAIF